MTLLEPNAFAPDNNTTTLYPMQVRFRVVAEVPPMEEDDIALLLGGGQPVRRVEPDVMQRIVDRMVKAGGGATTVAMKNSLPIPGFDPDPKDGKFREKLFIGDEITDDKQFRCAQRVAGPNGQNLMRIVNEVGMRTLVLYWWGVVLSRALGEKKDQMDWHSPSRPTMRFLFLER